MLAQDQTTSSKIAQKLAVRTEELTREFPFAADWVAQYTHIHRPSASSNLSVQQQVTKFLKKDRTTAEFLKQVSDEEYTVIFTKLQGALTNPASRLSQDDAAYLEQQLSDILGFTVTSQLQGHAVPNTVVTLKAGPHLKRFPKDSLSNHQQVPEAGLAATRSAFGWFSTHASLDEAATAAEQYYLALPLTALEEYRSTTAKLDWWRQRKVLVVNPRVPSIVIASIADTMIANTQYQAVGSPELLRASQCWSPGCAGMVLLFLIDDTEDTLPVGPIPIVQPTSLPYVA